MDKREQIVGSSRLSVGGGRCVVVVGNCQIGRMIKVIRVYDVGCQGK
jgi:hypothetical protein